MSIENEREKWPPTPEGYKKEPTYTGMFLFIHGNYVNEQDAIFARNHAFRKVRIEKRRRTRYEGYPIAAFKQVVMVPHIWHGEQPKTLPKIRLWDEVPGKVLRSYKQYGPYAIGMYHASASREIMPYNMLYSERKTWKRGSEAHLKLLFKQLGYELIP